MKEALTDPPGAVRPAEDLLTLAARANAAHEAGENSAREGLERFREAGEALLLAKEKCGHGKWLPWLEKNVKFSQPTAWAYMQVATHWEKLSAADNLRDALRMLTRKPPAEEADDEEGGGVLDDEDDTPLTDAL